MKNTLLTLLAAFPLGGTATAAAPAESCAVTVGDEPLVMRLGKDEFRIAFGVDGEQCQLEGCRGAIRYRAEWQTEHGASGSDSRLLSFNVPPGASRTIAVDRNYFDTAEGQHTTDIVKIHVDTVTCARTLAER